MLSTLLNRTDSVIKLNLFCLLQCVSLYALCQPSLALSCWGGFDYEDLKVLSSHLNWGADLIRFAVKYWKAGMFLKKFLMIPSHERSIKPFPAA